MRRAERGDDADARDADRSRARRRTLSSTTMRRSKPRPMRCARAPRRSAALSAAGLHGRDSRRQADIAAAARRAGTRSTICIGAVSARTPRSRRSRRASPKPRPRRCSRGRSSRAARSPSSGRRAWCCATPSPRRGVVLIDGNRMTMSWPSHNVRQTTDIGTAQGRVQKYFVDGTAAELRGSSTSRSTTAASGPAPIT